MRLPAEDCPHWEGCNAPLCPLDPAGKHLADEPVCRLAREIVKTGGYDHVAGYVGDAVAASVLRGIPRLRSTPDIARRLDRAALAPMNVGNAANLKRRAP